MSQNLATLRDILANLYADEASVQRVAADAGIDIRRLALNSTAQNHWHAVLSEANKINQMPALLRVVTNEYGNNPQLRAALVIYQQSVQPSLPGNTVTLMPENKQKIQQNGGQVHASQPLQQSDPTAIRRPSHYLLFGIISVVAGLLGNLIINQLWEKGAETLKSWPAILITLVLFALLSGLQLWLGWQSERHPVEKPLSPPNLPSDKNKTDAYFWVVMSEQDEFPAMVRTTISKYFAEHGIAETDVEAIVSVKKHSRANWLAQLEAVLKRLPEVIERYATLHFVCATPWLWAFALGTRLGTVMHFHFYHVNNDGKLYRVWQGTPSIKERVERPGFALPPERLTILCEGDSSTAAALVIAIGRNVSEQTVQFVQEHYPGVSVSLFYHAGNLDPNQPETWLQLAAELALAIEEVGIGGKREVYLFGSPPAALALMAGSAVKRFRPLRLFQHITATDYREMLTLSIKNS